MFDLVRRRWWALLAAVVVSAGVALPLALSAPSEYVSQAEVLIPASDPVATKTTQVSAIAIQLGAYANKALGEQVRSTLGPQASAIHSVAAVQQRSEDVYLVTATASIGSVAERAVDEASTSLIDRSNELALEQVQRLEDDVESNVQDLTQELVTLGADRREYARSIALYWERVVSLQVAPFTIADRAEIQELRERLKRLRAAHSLTSSQIRVLVSKRDAIQTLVEDATQRYLERRTASIMISPPSASDDTVRARIISTVGLAVLAGLIVSFLTILVIERWSRRRRAESQSSRSRNEQTELFTGRADVRGVRTP